MLKKLTILFFLIVGNISAQNPIHFSTKDGLPSNNVYDVLEDKDGFIWFATNRGLSKFDGKSFINFTIKNGLPNNDIWLLENDYKNRLWYFSKSKYQGYVQNDSIYKFKTEDDKVISPYVFKGKNKLVLGSYNCYALKDSKLVVVANQNEINKQYQLLNKKYSLIYSAYNINNNTFIGVSKNRIYVFDKDLNNIYQTKINFNATYKYISRRGKGLIMIAQNSVSFLLDDGIVFINDQTFKNQHYSFKELIGYNKFTFSNVKEDRNTIQITLDNHLLIFNHQFKLLQNILLPKNLPIQRAYQDSNKNIWTVDDGGGVYLISETQQNTNYKFIGKPTKKIGKTNHKLVVGINKKGIYELNNKTELFSNTGNFYQIDNNAIVSGSKTYINLKNKIAKFSFKVAEYTYNGFKDVLKEKDSVYIITGVDLAKANLVTNEGRSIQYKAGLVKLEKFNDRIYIGGSDGLWVLKNDSLVAPTIQHPILKTSINSMMKKDSLLYVATDGRGVYAFSKDTVIPLKNTEDLIVQKIIKKHNKLWLATQNGVVELTLNTTDFSNSKITNQFLEADGLLQNNTNDIYLKKDTIITLSDVGLASINYTNNIYKKPPNLYFKTYQPKTIITPNDYRNVSLGFGVKNFTNQQNINYEYRLLPTQLNWQKTPTQTLIFSNLSPNNYKLEVKAIDQHFNNVIKTHEIIVEPYWYETSWAKIGYFLGGLLLLFTGYNLVKKQIEKKEQLKSAQEKRIAGLELQALRSQMNPHFVHNSLNAIQYFIQRNEVELSEDYLAKFSKLVRLFFEYSRRQTISLKEEIKLLQNYLDIEKLRFEDKLNFNIKIDKTIDVEEQIIPSMILQPIIENAVNHGVFHKKEAGNIHIQFIYIDEVTYQVVIKDDGIGVDKAKEIYKHSTKNYQSRSSAVLQERLQLLQQSNSWNIDFKMTDAYPEKEEKGTLVQIIFNQTI